MGLTAELGALGTATREGAVERAVVRQYFDNGLAVYDAAGKRFGVVADYDRPGGGFVVHSEAARNLTSRSLDEGPRIRQPRPLLRVLRLLSGRMRTEKASA
jgi:hypothetical protein